MGLFEQNPWLLIPIIVATVEGWGALKAFAKELLHRRGSGIGGAARKEG